MQNSCDASLFFEFLKDQRKRAAELEKERARKRAAYAKKKAELQEYKQALKDVRAGWAMTVAAREMEFILEFLEVEGI